MLRDEVTPSESRARGAEVAGAGVDNEREVAGVVDGTLEQALNFKRTNRQSAKNKGYTLAAKEGCSSVGWGNQE